MKRVAVVGAGVRYGGLLLDILIFLSNCWLLLNLFAVNLVNLTV